jgi:flagellar motor switch protein FliN/FliY
MSDIGGATGSGGTNAAVSRAGFEEMAPTTSATSGDLGNLNLVLDVTVPVTVSIGSVRKKISEILALGPGQVIELDRAAGDPVDLFVNDRLVARGEVVVVGDRYGFRVTEITGGGGDRRG